MWATISSSNGDKNGKELKDLLTELMTPSQIEEAQRLAKECQEAINIGLTCEVGETTTASIGKATCKDDPKVCDSSICYYATKISNGDKVWDMWGAGKEHMKEAKSRGLSCGVGETGSEGQNCYKDPKLCGNIKLCDLATTGNPRNWNTTYNTDHSMEAKLRGLTCGVEPVSVIAENVHGSKLPPCPEDTSKVFNNCYGYSDFEDGASYIGEWQNDKMHGIGTFTFPKEENGQYIGNFADNEFSGQGKLTFPDMTYEGNFKNDAFEGQGTLITEEGKFVGNFKDGELDGLGKYYDESGELIFEGQFAKGEPVQPHVEPTPSGKDNDDGELFAASSGTGFYVTNDGYLLTNHHVINGCQKVGVVSRGELIDTKIIAFDKINDLAILKVSKEPEDYLTISRDLPEITEEIIVAGFPFGEEFSSTVKVTKGIVSSLAGVENNYSEIQIDAAIQPGNSGGPIINEYGNVIGIAVAGLDQQYVQENFGVTPESSNFGVKASVAINLLNANGIKLSKPLTSIIKRQELGEKIRKATLYLSCGMTLAQIEQVKTKKLLFKKYE